jgi:very-short-patch-repair endonuclease
VAAVAAHQHQLVTRDQLRSLGLADRAIHRWSAAGTLERLAPHVFRIAGSEATWWQRCLAGVLARPPGTVVSHRAAAAAHDLRGFSRGPVEVITPGRRSRRPAGVRVHERPPLTEADRAVVRGVPVTSVVRTLIDLAAVAHPHKVGLALDDARRRRLTDLASVELRFEQLAGRGRDGTVAMRQLLLERHGQVAGSTGFEDLLLDILADHGLPRPEVQWQVRDSDFVAYLDVAYPAAMLAIEADSEAYHLDLAQFRHDRSRQNRLSLLGWRFLRFTDHHLLHERPDVAAQVRTALAAAAADS